MRFFSKEIKNFLTGLDSDENISIVSKSESSAKAGDIVFFRYSLGRGVGSRTYRIFLLTEPITRQAKTGNLLLTGFKLKNLADSEALTFTASNVLSLYKESKVVKKKSKLEKTLENKKKLQNLNIKENKQLSTLEKLFIENEIGSEYRTYIMSKIFGPIRKITKNKETF